MADSKSEPTPLPVDGVDLRSLPIGPEEAFVLSRVDGATSRSDIAAATGLDADRVDEILQKLGDLGAVSFGDAVRREPEQETNNRTVADAAKIGHAVDEAPSDRRSASGRPAAALYDPAELDEDVDIELPKRRQILDTYYKLDSLSYYDLLEIDESADKKAVKSSYYRIVTIYHPDKYFGKNVGSFKGKLEKIFKGLTEAHDVLTKQKAREEYDAYLATQARTRNLDQAARGTAAQAKEIERVRREIEEQARIAERAAQQLPRTGTPSSRPSDPKARQRALARKLGRGTVPPARRSSPPIDRGAVKEVVADDLRRRYESRLADAKVQQVSKYVTAAERALEQNDKASAVNALRIASSLSPDDEDLGKRVEDLQNQVDADLAETYLQSAQYEERNRRYKEAAVSYRKALRGKLPGRASILERAASCILQAEEDLREASELAKEAVGLAPDAPQARATLARIYLALDLKKSALGEFERASALAPQDDTIKDWIKRIKKGEV